jgi:hypothetical protein
MKLMILIQIQLQQDTCESHSSKVSQQINKKEPYHKILENKQFKKIKLSNSCLEFQLQSNSHISKFHNKSDFSRLKNLNKIIIKQNKLTKIKKSKQKPLAMEKIKLMRRDSARSLPIESSLTIFRMFSTSINQQE